MVQTWKRRVARNIERPKQRRRRRTRTRVAHWGERWCWACDKRLIGNRMALPEHTPQPYPLTRLMKGKTR